MNTAWGFSFFYFFRVGGPVGHKLYFLYRAGGPAGNEHTTSCVNHFLVENYLFDIGAWWDILGL